MFLCSSCGTQQAALGCKSSPAASVPSQLLDRRRGPPNRVFPRPKKKNGGAYSVCPIPVRAFKMCAVILLMIISLPQEKEL